MPKSPRPRHPLCSLPPLYGLQELEWVREYAYELRPKDIDTAGYFLNFHEGQVVYNEYASKIALTRKTFQVP